MPTPVKEVKAFGMVATSWKTARQWFGVIVLVALLGAVPTAAGSSLTTLATSGGFQALSTLLFLISGLIITHLGLRQLDGLKRPTFKQALYVGGEPAVRYLLGWLTLLGYALFAPTVGAIRLTRAWWRNAGRRAHESVGRRALQIIAYILGIMLCVIAGLINLILWALASLASSGYTSGIPVLAQLPLLVIIPFVFILVRFGLMLVAITDTRRGPIEAISYVRVLVRSQRKLFWRFEGAILLVVLLFAAVLYLGILLIGLALPNESALTFVFLTLMLVLTMPFVILFQTKLYRHLEERLAS